MKFSLVTISFFVSVLLATHMSRTSDTCPRQVPEQYKHIQPGNVVAAYFASWDIYGKHKYDVTDMYPFIRGNEINSKVNGFLNIFSFSKPSDNFTFC